MSIVPTWHGVYVLYSYDFAVVFSRLQYVKCLLVTCGPSGPEGGQSLYKDKALNMIKGKHMAEAQVVKHGGPGSDKRISVDMIMHTHDLVLIARFCIHSC
eukprot:scaffold6680_cov298-Chaetoceros_neogracile.AAC.2